MGMFERVIPVPKKIRPCFPDAVSDTVGTLRENAPKLMPFRNLSVRTCRLTRDIGIFLLPQAAADSHTGFDRPAPK